MKEAGVWYNSRTGRIDYYLLRVCVSISPGVLLVDDDMLISEGDIEFAFDNWKVSGLYLFYRG